MAKTVKRLTHEERIQAIVDGDQRALAERIVALEDRVSSLRSAALNTAAHWPPLPYARNPGFY